MKLRPELLAWQVRSMRLSIVSIPIACLWVLLLPVPLFKQGGIAAIFIGFHAAAIAAELGRPRSDPFNYLISRGFSRDELWAHTMLASLAGVIATWLPAAALIWSGARAWVGDEILRSPYQPLVWPREAWVPAYWLTGYIMILPVFHYSWLRQAQRTRRPHSGNWLAILYVIIVFWAWNMAPHVLQRAPMLRWSITGGGMAIALMLLWAGRHLYRRLEAAA